MVIKIILLPMWILQPLINNNYCYTYYIDVECSSFVKAWPIIIKSVGNSYHLNQVEGCTCILHPLSFKHKNFNDDCVVLR